ncbi:MAG: hypothetical protein FWG07_07850 [Treponema sp.]|nr:hypothetical protein [Treponema sp.]
MFEEFDFYPLKGQPYFNNDKYWISPFNFIPENLAGYPEKIIIHDCTLRDGEQTPRVYYTKPERVRIARQLNELGVDRIEIGMPIISEELRNAIKEVMTLKLKSKVVAFARANPEDVRLSVECGVEHIIIEHTVNPYLCKYAYKLDQDQLCQRVHDNVLAAKKAGLWVNYMGWDFSRTPLEYSRKAYQAAIDAGASAITLVDTFAVTTPKAIGYAVKQFREWFPDIIIEFHVHNDFGLGMATALAAVENGATIIHTAMNALGERTGNLATEEVATTFGILMGGRTNVNLDKLYETSRVISDITGVYPNVNKTVFGKNCFAIESGVVSHYTNALREAGFKPIAYPYLPEVVGRKEDDFLIGSLSGKLTIEYYLNKNNIKATPEQQEDILAAVKEECIVRKALLLEEDLVSIADRVLNK